MKKFFSIAFIAVLGLFLVACGGDDTTTTTDAPSTGSTTEPVALSTLIDSLKTEYADTLDNATFLATEDLTLLETIGGYTITWSSNKTDFIANDGTITRPSYSEGDETVALTASVTDGTDTESYTFFVTVQKLDKTDQERADEVFLDVVVFPSKEYWTVADSDSLEFLATGEDADGVEYAVTWSSSDTTHFIIDGTEGEIVQSLDAVVNVTVTVTVNINGTDYSTTRDFAIAQIEAPTEVATIALALAEEEDSYVKIPGVTVTAIDSDGNVFFTDGTDVLYIYGAALDVEVGDVIDISGELYYYYYSPQLISTDSHPVVATASTAAVSADPVTTVASVTELLSGLSVPSATNTFNRNYYEITAAVYYDEAWGEKYCVFLVDSDYDFTTPTPDGATQPNGDNKLMMYYKSDIDVLKALHGEVVTIKVLTVGYRDDKLVYYADFFGTPADITVSFSTDEEAVSAALNSVLLPEQVLANTTLDLPAAIYGVDMTYSSSNEAVFNSTTGAVDLTGLTTQVTVELTVTATKGTVEESVILEVKVGELPLSTLAEAAALEVGTAAKIQGVVYAIIKDGFFVEDTSGKLFVYTGSDSFDYDLGDEVLLVGEVGEYRDAKQLVDVEEYTDPLQTGVACEQTATVYEDGTTTMVPGYVYTITGQLSIETSGSYTNTYLYLNDTDKAQIYYNSPDDSMTAIEAFDGKVITANFIFYNTKPYLVFVGETADITEYVMTDAEIVAADKAALDFGGNVYEATDIDLPATGANGSTITWAITSDTDTKATYADGTLSLLAAGETESTVEITATIASNAEQDTIVFTYTLKNLVVIDVADVPSQTEGDLVSVTGYVYAVVNGGCFVEDETGKIFIYNWDISYNVGDEVLITGEVATYSGEYQLTNLVDIQAAISTDNDVTQTPVAYEPGVTVLEAGTTYQMIGTIAIEGDHDNVFIYVTETEAFEVYYQSPSASITALEALVGEEVVVNVIYYNGSDTVVYDGGTDGVSVVYTDFAGFHAMTDDAYDMPNEDVYVKGVVSAVAYNGVFLQDTNGVGLFLYYPDFRTTANVGDEVIVFGTLGSYSGARQLTSSPELVSLVNTGVTVIDNTYTLADLLVVDHTDAGTYMTVTGLVVDHYDGNDVYFKVVSGEQEDLIYLSYYTSDAEWLEEIYPADSTLPEVKFVLYNYKNDITTITCFEIELTEAQTAQVDANDIPTTLTISEDYEIEAALYGSTITVTGVNAALDAYIDYTTTPGTLTLLSTAGLPVTGEVYVDVTNGATTVSVTIALTIEENMTLLYSTGFETSEGYTASTSYSSGVVVNGWTVVDGTITATNASSEDLHLQMRDYADGTVSYAEYYDGTTLINRVVFNAFTNSAGTQLTVQFSTDGTTWSTGTVIDLTTSDATYTVDSDVVDATYVRFTETTETESTQRVSMDDVKIY